MASHKLKKIKDFDHTTLIMSGKYCGSERRAVMSEVGILQAMHIWRKILKLDKYYFKDKQKLTEKNISILTWDGCTADKYEENPLLYKRWNNQVINKWMSLDDKCRMVRIRGVSTTNPTTGQRITRLCRSDKKNTVDRLKHKVNISAGIMSSALRDNEHYELDQDVGQLFFQGLHDKTKTLPGMNEERTSKALLEFTNTQLVEAGKLLGREEVADSILNVLDMRPALMAKDEEASDSYSDSAKERRKQNGGRS
jgi:hypothetical protein